jgi:hypothetical protein
MFSEYSGPSTEKEARSAGVWALVSKFAHISVLLGKAHIAGEKPIALNNPIRGASGRHGPRRTLTKRFARSR